MIDDHGNIRGTVTVDVDQEKALRSSPVTSRRVAEDYHIGQAPIAEFVIEPHRGGRWYTRHTDGSETSTGHVISWEPPSRLIVTWQISAHWLCTTAIW
jgi:hypothetical protein